jgi:ABC-type multidrug transport system fused ATPase/permease subunit
MFKTLRALIASLPPRRRIQLVLLLGLMLVGALAEVLSLGAIVPFLAILADPVQALQRPLVAQVVATLGLSDAEDIRWQLTLLFASTAVAAGIVRFVLIYAIAKLNFGIGHELGAEVYRRTLYQPYEVHVARNSSAIMGGINKVDIVVFVVFSLLNAGSATGNDAL